MYAPMNRSRIQGVLVDVGGVGVLIQGPPGIGKSLAALHLMSRGHKLVSDDLVQISVSEDGKLVGMPVEEQVRIEVRGLGIYRARALFDEGTSAASSIDFAVNLETYDPLVDVGRTEPEMTAIQIMGCELQRIRLPLTRGSDPALLIELLAKLFRSHGTVRQWKPEE